ncbi:hypothetical protein [Yinghuangia seranimata]|uniref:hypothetical protein n=1 Tax=Yinghuangia seranimata TaxID=408067 RepID=UPI00248CAEF4|nr:hypothetical protein [Yinghuangia seranimata]MDI2129616.1 hypothetical protein [Yinghuangia seranimata]
MGELRGIAEPLGGTLDIVADPAGLAADLAQAVGSWLEKDIANLYLRVWTPRSVRVTRLHQVSPFLSDVGAPWPGPNRNTVDYLLGSLGAEGRQFDLRLALPCEEPGTEILGARLGLVLRAPAGDGADSDDVHAQCDVPVVWRDGAEL